MNNNMNLNPKRQYTTNAKGQIIRVKKRLLALYNEKVSYAFGYCKLKECYLTSNNMKEKQCLMKGKKGSYCPHLYILEGHERIEGVKHAKQKEWKGKNKNEI